MNAPAPDRSLICSKQNCRRPAQIALTFDYEARMAWLDDDGPGADVRATKLCLVCSDRFVVPIGWQLVDRSDPGPPPPSQRPATHPAVAVRGTHEPGDVEAGIELTVPDEEHPSGPLDLQNRREPAAVTRELERLARDLDTVASPDPGPAAPEERRTIRIRRAASPGEAVSPPDDIDEDTFGDELDAEMTEELSIVGLSDRSWPEDDDTQVRPPRWADPR